MKSYRKGNVWAGHGGCWFCWVKDDQLTFDIEFDTFVHVACIRQVLTDHPDDPEADMMRYLLDEKAI